MTSGMSVFETIFPIRDVGLHVCHIPSDRFSFIPLFFFTIQVKDVTVLIDREQGGRANVESDGIRLHAVLKITDVLEVLLKESRIDQACVDRVKKFVQENQVLLQLRCPLCHHLCH